MDSFQANTCWERPKKRENKNYHYDQFQSDLEQRIPQKKIAKKLNNNFMASFQGKIGWQRPRKREKKNYHSDQFLPDPEQRIP